MRSLITTSILLLLAACGSSDGGNRPPAPADTACSATGQKQFVLDASRQWYLWNDRLPATVDIGDFATPEELLQFLMTFSPPNGSGQPVDLFSFITTAEQDQQFFGEGKFEGFGFGTRFVAADDLRLTRVFSGSPAEMGGLGRGQRILRLNDRTIAEIQAAEGVGAVFDTSPLDFTMQRPDNSEFTATLTRDIVTIDPVPQWRLIPRAGNSPVGYIEFSQFISTANAVLNTIFADFAANNVTDVIIDLRYNGGGLVSTANLLGDLLGGSVASNLIFTDTRFNADRSSENTIRRFSLLGNSIGLTDLVIIATSGTASASELIANGMEPHVRVAIVGDDTFGKPIGQAGFEFCENILRLTAFQFFNADGFGDYFDGLPVAPGCAAPDELSIAVGADTDPNMVAAMGYLDTGACQVAVKSGARFSPKIDRDLRQLDRRGPPSRVIGDVW